MARTSTYLNFDRQTEAAFIFYQSIFGGNFKHKNFQRFGDVFQAETSEGISADDLQLVLHAELEILGGHILMGTDVSESMGFQVIVGNNVHLNLEPDTKEEADYLFEALSAGGTVTAALSDTFWGAYYGSLTDKFGIHWMVNVTNQA